MALQIDALGGIDYMLLGMGQNGHLALNEPGCALYGGPHTTVLSETTKQVGQKYFSEARALVGGITLGIADITAARQVDLVVNGTHKQEIVARFCTAEPGNELPASMLKLLPQASVYFDSTAAALAIHEGVIEG